MVVVVPRNAQRQLPEAVAFTVARRWPLLSVVAVVTVLYAPPGFLCCSFTTCLVNAWYLRSVQLARDSFPVTVSVPPS